jgi:hypothetical protein
VRAKTRESGELRWAARRVGAWSINGLTPVEMGERPRSRARKKELTGAERDDDGPLQERENQVISPGRGQPRGDRRRVECCVWGGGLDVRQCGGASDAVTSPMQ